MYRGPLAHSQYYCSTEVWKDKMGSPMSNPWEPNVVLRHCGKDESVIAREHLQNHGELSHINEENPWCSCEWGFAQPTPLAELRNNPACRLE